MTNDHYEQLREKASIAHKNKLFVKNKEYQLRTYLKNIKYADFNKHPSYSLENCFIDDWAELTINLEYRDNEAVGVALINNTRNELLAIYVKQKYRRQGIGKALCQSSDISTCNEGTDSGTKFFLSMGYYIKSTEEL